MNDSLPADTLGMTRDQGFSPEVPFPKDAVRRFRELGVVGRPAPDRTRVRRVLVRSPNWLGDAVMSLPVLHALSRLYPGASFTYLAVPRVAPLFLHHPLIRRVLPYPPGREKWRLLWSLRGAFDLALALPNSLGSALDLWLTGTPARVGYDADARRPFLTRAVLGRHRLKGLHLVFYYLGILQALDGPDSFTPPHLYLDRGEEQRAASRLATAAPAGSGPWVGLSPGAAYGPAKRWPPERFAALGNDLAAAGARLVLLGGAEDRPAAAAVKSHLAVPALDLVGATDLRQALAVLRRLRLLVTNDSGLMHAAAALGTPLVAVFGSTDPAATGAFTDRATVLHHPLPCSPCFRRTCPEDYPCLTAITVEEAGAAARTWLGETP